MITITNAKFSHYAESGVAVNVYEIAGLSTDSKPVTADVGNGSTSSKWIPVRYTSTMRRGIPGVNGGREHGEVWTFGTPGWRRRRR